MPAEETTTQRLHHHYEGYDFLLVSPDGVGSHARKLDKPGTTVERPADKRLLIGGVYSYTFPLSRAIKLGWLTR